MTEKLQAEIASLVDRNGQQAKTIDHLITKLRLAQEERDEARLSVKQLTGALDLFQKEVAERAIGVERALAALGAENLRLMKLLEERKETT